MNEGEISPGAIDTNLHIYSVNWPKPGGLGEYFKENTNLANRLLNPATSAETGMVIFNKIHEKFLGDRSEESNKLFGLYENADLRILMNAVSDGMTGKSDKELSKFIKPEEFKQMSQAVRFAHDILFWAGRRDDVMFTKTVELFWDEYNKDTFFKSQEVQTAMKAYENTLRNFDRSHQIKDREQFTDLSHSTDWDGETRKLYLSTLKNKSKYSNCNTDLILTIGKAVGLATGKFHRILGSEIKSTTERIQIQPINKISEIVRRQLADKLAKLIKKGIIPRRIT